MSSSIRRALWLSLLIVGQMGCQRKSSTDREFPPLEFVMDAGLLAAPSIIDSAFSIRFPGDWHALPDSSFQVLRQVIEQDTAAYFKLSLLSARRAENGSLCAVSRLLAEAAPFRRLDALYDGILKDGLDATEVARGSFSINGARTVQYRIINNEQIIFKLFSNVRETYYQIDFLMPKTAYETEIRKVESSLGSLHPL